METYEEAMRFLSELCDEHNAAMRGKHWLPFESNRAMHEKRELGICDALTILREHVGTLEGKIEALEAALNEREDEQEHVDVFVEEPESAPEAMDFGDETEAMERFERAQERESAVSEGESCAPCAAAKAAAELDAALED